MKIALARNITTIPSPQTLSRNIINMAQKTISNLRKEMEIIDHIALAADA